MCNIEKLEKKWFKYKFKKIISPLATFSVLAIVVGVGYSMYDKKVNTFFSSPLPLNKTNILGVSVDANKTQVKLEEKVSKVEPKVEIIEEVVAEKIALTPIIPVIDMEKEERISDAPKRKAKKQTSNLVRAKPNKYLTASELAVITKAEKNVATVVRKTKKMNFKSSSVNYIETMKAKFAKSNKPRDALLLAKVYYKNKNYKASEKWALSANKLNNSLEESWLLFAKAKAKLGKKKEALKILVSYHKRSHSQKAKRLIGKIRTGQI